MSRTNFNSGLSSNTRRVTKSVATMNPSLSTATWLGYRSGIAHDCPSYNPIFDCHARRPGKAIGRRTACRCHSPCIRRGIIRNTGRWAAERRARDCLLGTSAEELRVSGCRTRRISSTLGLRGKLRPDYIPSAIKDKSPGFSLTSHLLTLLSCASRRILWTTLFVKSEIYRH